MSDGAAPRAQGAPRHTQGDELIVAIQRNTQAIVALTVAVGALAAMVKENTDTVQELLESMPEGDDDEEESACDDPDCDDPDCDGGPHCEDCDTSPCQCDLPPRPRRRRR